MQKEIQIGGRSYTMRASALTPRLYRREFGRDLFRDMSGLLAAYKRRASLAENAAEEDITEADLEILGNLEIFENLAWIFLKDGGEDVGSSPDEWLNSLDGVFSVYEIMPAILELWGTTQTTTSSLKNREGLR